MTLNSDLIVPTLRMSGAIPLLPVLPRLPVKGKSVPLQAWSGPEGSRKLRLPDFLTTAQDGGRLSAAAFTPRKYSWYSFMLEAESNPGP